MVRGAAQDTGALGQDHVLLLITCFLHLLKPFPHLPLPFLNNTSLKKL